MTSRNILVPLTPNDQQPPAAGRCREVLHKEIDLLQACIKRMADNSFMLKGWAMIVLVVVGTVSALSDPGYFLFGALVPMAAFWYLDAYFLQQERLYRIKYRWLVKNHASSTKYLYDLTPTNLPYGNKTKVDCIPLIMFSHTLRIFYPGLMILVLFLTGAEICNNPHW